MAYTPIQTENTLDKVYLSETTKEVFDKINANSAEEDTRADRADAKFEAIEDTLADLPSTYEAKFTDGSAGIASVSNDVVTLKSGVAQSGGAISNSSGADITLAKVAKTGAYSDLSGQPAIPTKDSDLINDRYIRYDTNSQGLTDTQKSNARTNIGAGTVTSVSAEDGLEITGGASTTPIVGVDSAHKLPTTTEYNALATKTYVDTAIDNLPEPMIFKGTLGTGGTITTLPAASASNEGFTYKVITAGTYASQTAKVGDIFTSNGTEWVLIPAGDDIDDTWRAINVNGTQLLSEGISSGAVNFKNGGNVTVTGSGNDITLGVESGYSIPSITRQNSWTSKQDALDAQTAYTAKGTSTKVPQITTNTLGQVTKIEEKDITFPVTSVNGETGAITGLATTAQLSNKMDKVNPTGTGAMSINRLAGTTVGANSTALGNNTSAVGDYSSAEGNYANAIGEASHAEGYGSAVATYLIYGDAIADSDGYYRYTLKDPETGNIIDATTSNNLRSHRAVINLGTKYTAVVSTNTGLSTGVVQTTTALSSSLLNWVSAKVYYQNAVGKYSHVEGAYCTTYGEYSHAEGYESFALGYYSHAEGNSTTAQGNYSHAEGYKTKAGHRAHAEGYCTTANKMSSHVFGEYNKIDTEDNPLSRGSGYGRYVEIVGNGTRDDRLSNARTLDWNGNEWIAGNMKVNKTTLANTASNDITVNLPSSAGTLALVSDIPAPVDPAILSDFTETDGTTTRGESYTWSGPVNDVYTLTITFTDGKEHHPFVCYNSNNTQVMVELAFTAVSGSSSTITMKTNSKFIGKIYSI